MHFLKEVIQSDSTEKKENKKHKLVEKAPPKQQNEGAVEGLTEKITTVNLKDKTDERIMENPIVEKEVEVPVVKEKIIPQVKEVVQPVLVRETQTTEVRHVLQPLYKKEVRPTEIVETEFPSYTIPETFEKPRPEDISKYREAHFREISSSEVAQPQIEKTVLPPIVKERIIPLIHEEIQPVIMQETLQPILIHETRPIYHRVVEAPKIVEEVRPAKSVEDAKDLLENVGQTVVISGAGQVPTKQGQQ